MRKKLLDLDELKKVNGGTFAESWDIVDAIDRNPYLSDMWDAVLNEVCGWEIEDENDLFFLRCYDRSGKTRDQIIIP